METFNTYLQKKRLENQYTLRKLAELLCISPSYLVDMEKGTRPAPNNPSIIKGMIKQLHIPAKQQPYFYDLIGESRNELPPDIISILKNNPVLKTYIRNHPKGTKKQLK